MMRVTELREKYLRKIPEAERTEARAPLSTVYQVFVEDLDELDRIGEEPVYLTTTDVAERFEVKPKTVATWCRDGRFPNAFKTGEDGEGEWRIPTDDLRGHETGQTVDDGRVSFRDRGGGRP